MTTIPDQAIQLTAPGAAAIAVVRLRGEGVRSFFARHFSKTPVAGRCVHGELRDGERVIDDPVVVLLPDGLGADVNLHGGPWVVSLFLKLAQQHGFTLIETIHPPLHESAVDGDSVFQREVLVNLPLAKTLEALRVLLAQREAWSRVGEESAPAAKEVLKDRSLWWLLHPPRVAIVGAANVGKSTLANQLFAQERSISADLPGTTRDWIGESANLDGLVVTLVDTPGLRDAPDPLEQLAISRSAEQISAADLVLLVLDASRPLEDQQQFVKQFPGALVVINKSDRALDWCGSFAGGLRTVATTGAGVDAVPMAIRKQFQCDDFDETRPRWWTERQREILARSIASPDVIREIQAPVE
jgi:small GTP-binding protein